MKTVYVIIQFYPYEGYDAPEAVFSSKEIAEQYLKQKNEEDVEIFPLKCLIP